MRSLVDHATLPYLVGRIRTTVTGDGVSGWTPKKIALFVLAVLVFLFYAIKAEMRLGLLAGILFVILGVAIFLFEVRRLKRK
jgi:hypothetical protein